MICLGIRILSSRAESISHSFASLTRERYFQHSKIKFVSPRGHVISSIYKTSGCFNISELSRNRKFRSDLVNNNATEKIYVFVPDSADVNHSNNTFQKTSVIHKPIDQSYGR